jgi:hypothetical protein
MNTKAGEALLLLLQRIHTKGYINNIAPLLKIQPSD